MLNYIISCIIFCITKYICYKLLTRYIMERDN